MLVWFLSIFRYNITWPRARIYCKNWWFCNIFVFKLLCWWTDSVIDFWLNFGASWVWKSSQNRSKIDQKIHQQRDVILNWFLMALGPILGRFWLPSWSQVGTKIAPRWHRNRYQNMVKKLIQNLVCPELQGAAGRRSKSGCWPLRNDPQCPQGH